VGADDRPSPSRLPTREEAPPVSLCRPPAARHRRVSLTLPPAVHRSVSSDTHLLPAFDSCPLPTPSRSVQSTSLSLCESHNCSHGKQNAVRSLPYHAATITALKRSHCITLLVRGSLFQSPFKRSLLISLSSDGANTEQSQSIAVYAYYALNSRTADMTKCPTHTSVPTVDVNNTCAPGAHPPYLTRTALTISHCGPLTAPRSLQALQSSLGVQGRKYCQNGPFRHSVQENQTT